MKNTTYEAPKFDFQELRLLERVADKCWGASKIAYDADGNGYISEDEILSIGNGCGNWEKIFEDYFGITAPADIDTNTKNPNTSIIKPVWS